MLRSEITEEGIGALVETFYAKIRHDSRLGPIFAAAIDTDAWPVHLDTMRAFWSSVMITSGRYKGNPMVAHLRLKMLRPEDFPRWLALFDETTAELFDPIITSQFKEKAHRIARSLAMGMFPITPPERPRP